ncbi:hypothetical protein MHBO_001460 [Bonamia ostreae]|uniref:Protein-L-isoaspartate O-methyltransferase n=1 Tax=Bonamia ostreae TaxID=126728 RepID=A0ABV2AJ17_9EUKA
MTSSGIVKNKDLIQYLIKGKILKNERAVIAMMQVDRKNFCTSKYPYRDIPTPIGNGATISAPHIHALYIELLSDFLKPGAKALDIGSGSGYSTAVMAHMVKPGGKAVGIEQIRSLVKFSNQNVDKDSYSLRINNNIEFVEGDGREGWAKEAPYDAIHVGAASEGIPKTLKEQLKIGGRMILPVNTPGDKEKQILMQVDKKGPDSFEYTDLGEVLFYFKK